MNNKQATKTHFAHSIRSMLTILVLILNIGCDNPIFHHRPSNKACMTYLSGEKIILEKGLLMDTTWTIEAGEFTAFSIESITKNEDGTRTAKVMFELKAGSRGLRVEADVRYQHHKKDNYIHFLGWTPTRVLRLGKW